LLKVWPAIRFIFLRQHRLQFWYGKCPVRRHQDFMTHYDDITVRVHPITSLNQLFTRQSMSQRSGCDYMQSAVALKPEDYHGCLPWQFWPQRPCCFSYRWDGRRFERCVRAGKDFRSRLRISERSKKLAARAEKEKDAGTLAFVALSTTDPKGAAALTERSVSLDPELIWFTVQEIIGRILIPREGNGLHD
jgi:hypothetical protein